MKISVNTVESMPKGVIKITPIQSVRTLGRLKILATDDGRTASGEIEALVNQEWERRQPSAAVPARSRE